MRRGSGRAYLRLVTRRQWAFDVGLAAGIAVLTQVEAWDPHSFVTTRHQGPSAAMAAGYLVAAAALVLRRVRPLTCAAVVAGALSLQWLVFGSPEGLGVLAAPCVAAYSVAAYERRGRALPGLAMVLGMGLVWVGADPTEHSWTTRVQGLVWLSPFVIAWLLGAYRRTRRLYVEQLVREREERAATAVADERNRIARELHDVLGHSVSVMTVQASAVRRLLRGDQAKERAALETVESTGREALAEMRRMVGVLRQGDESPDLTPPPSLGNLDHLVENFRRAGLDVALDVHGDAVPLPPGVDLTAYRLVQEALTNTLKHAQASRATVLVVYREGALELVVRDDGRGGPVEESVGNGLIGMRERVGVYGGALVAGPVAGGGFELRAELPLDRP